MRFTPRAILAGGTGFAVSLLAACGGGGNGLLSGGQSSNLQNRLNQISSAVASRDCVSADQAASALAQTVVSLPASVNVTVRQDLAQGAHTVAVLAQRGCMRPKTTSTANTTSTRRRRRPPRPRPRRRPPRRRAAPRRRAPPRRPRRRPLRRRLRLRRRTPHPAGAAASVARSEVRSMAEPSVIARLLESPNG